MQKLLITSAAICLLAACGQSSENTKTDPEANTPEISAADLPEVPAGVSAAEQAAVIGAAFLEENKTMPGVKTTESGLQYVVVESGDAAGAHPKPGQIVCAHYAGRFINGEEFDSSYGRELPMAHPSNGFISGWNEALSMMRPGDKWKLFVPSDLAYGATGTIGGPIGPNETLVFDMELISNLDITMAEHLSTYAKDRSLDCSKHGG